MSTIGDIGTIDFRIKEERDKVLKLLHSIPVLENKEVNMKVLESLARAIIKKYEYNIAVIYFGEESYTASIEKEKEKMTIIYALTIEEFFIKMTCFLYWHNKKKRYI